MVNTLFNCDITARTLGHTISILLDFGDADIRRFNMKDNSLTLTKTYRKTGNYKIIATATNTSMSVFEMINGSFFFFFNKNDSILNLCKFKFKFATFDFIVHTRV